MLTVAIDGTMELQSTVVVKSKEKPVLVVPIATKLPSWPESDSDCELGIMEIAVMDWAAPPPVVTVKVAVPSATLLVVGSV